MIQKIKIFSLLVIFLTLFTQPGYALPTDSRVPGGIAIIDIGKNQLTPEFTFQKKKVLAQKVNDSWKLYIGLPLSIKPGEHSVKGHFGHHSALVRHFFTVKDKKYKTQSITIKNKRKVNPYANDMDRIIREKGIKNKARKTLTNNIAELDFIQPVEGILTGSYGKRRVFNGQKRNPHSGMDIAANKGVPVKAAAAGKVIETGDFFFSGNMVYLNHGQGLISLYAHLDTIKVKKGDVIKQGDILGTVGETGRVTGPHLHWSVGLNQSWIDPALFIK